VCDRDGRHPIQLTAFNGPDVGSPSWSPDSRWIAFDSSKGGNWDIYVISVEGGQPRRLTTGAANHVQPSLSKDGRWIYYGAGDEQIWKAPAQGGAPVQVTKGGGGNPIFESADGSFVYYDRSVIVNGDPGIWRMPAAGGEETHVFDRVGTRFDKLVIWALTGQGICFLGSDGSAGPVLNFYDFATGKVSAMRKFPKDSQDNWLDTPLAISPDGLWILYSHLDQADSNLMLVENFR
jgi:Tol biopolymer transport system component